MAAHIPKRSRPKFRLGEDTFADELLHGGRPSTQPRKELTDDWLERMLLLTSNSACSKSCNRHSRCLFVLFDPCLDIFQNAAGSFNSFNKIDRTLPGKIWIGLIHPFEYI